MEKREKGGMDMQEEYKEEYIVVMAMIQAKESEKELVKEALCWLVEPTRKEKGCLIYTFYQNKENKALFYSYEIWENQSAIDKHLESGHIKAYEKATENLVEVFEIKEFTKICL